MTLRTINTLSTPVWEEFRTWYIQQPFEISYSFNFMFNGKEEFRELFQLSTASQWLETKGIVIDLKHRHSGSLLLWEPEVYKINGFKFDLLYKGDDFDDYHLTRLQALQSGVVFAFRYLNNERA